MTKTDINKIKADERYYIIYHENGQIYTKLSLIELRKKKIEKLFRGIEFHCRPCSYNDYFMNNVYILYKRLKARDKWYYSRGYKKVYYKDQIGYEFIRKDEED